MSLKKEYRIDFEHIVKLINLNYNNRNYKQVVDIASFFLNDPGFSGHRNFFSMLKLRTFAYFSQGLFVEASADALRLAEHLPQYDTAQHILLRIQNYFKQPEYNSLFMKQKDLWLHYAYIFKAVKDFKKASFFFLYGILLNPENIQLQISYARNLLLLNHIDAYNEFVIIYSKIESEKDKLPHYDILIVDVIIELVSLYFVFKDFESAKMLLHKHESFAEKNPLLYQQLGKCYLHLKEADSSEKYFLKAFKSDKRLEIPEEFYLLKETNAKQLISTKLYSLFQHKTILSINDQFWLSPQIQDPK